MMKWSAEDEVAVVVFSSSSASFLPSLSWESPFFRVFVMSTESQEEEEEGENGISIYRSINLGEERMTAGKIVFPLMLMSFPRDFCRAVETLFRPL